MKDTITLFEIAHLNKYSVSNNFRHSFSMQFILTVHSRYDSFDFKVSKIQTFVPNRLTLLNEINK